MAKRSKGDQAGKWAGQDTHTIQCWPGGESYVYQGDADGPADRRRLKGRDTGTGEGRQAARWRRGTVAEWRTIRISRRAEMYRDHYVLRCQTSLVEDLIKAGGEGLGGTDLARAFEYDQIENVYQDPSDWDAAQCREYASDQGIDLPEVPTVECETCGGSGIALKKNPISGGPQSCAPCKGTGQIPEADYEDDDTGRGWLAEARDVCRDHAQDHPAEVFEWWLVDSWLLARLREIGEVVIDNDYGEWWGRCATGQAYIMDGVLQKIAARFEREGM